MEEGETPIEFMSTTIRFIKTKVGAQRLFFRIASRIVGLPIIFFGENLVLQKNTWGTNLWWGSSTSGQAGLPGSRIVQDPLMTSPATGNLEIASTSPAKDVGVEEADLTWPDAFWSANFPSGIITAHGELDYGMYPRIDNILDIGADEYNASSPMVKVAPKVLLQGPFDRSTPMHYCL